MKCIAGMLLVANIACAPTVYRVSSPDGTVRVVDRDGALLAPGTEDDTHPDDHAERPQPRRRVGGASRAWIVPVVLGGIGIFVAATVGVIVITAVNGVSNAGSGLASNWHR